MESPSTIVTLHGTLADPSLWTSEVNYLDIQEPLTTHHALAPHPHVIIFSSIILSMDCTVFIVLQMTISAEK